jgi:AcrR family transcriptional regulator
MSSRQLTRREKQQHTRSSLLRAATKLFCRQGLEGASVDQVAQAAGYTKGAFYANFKSKEELFLVMLDERFARELERIDRALSGSEEPRLEARAAAADFIHFAGDEDWPRLYFQFVAHAARDDEFRQELATRQQAMREKLAETFARWKQGLEKEDHPVPLQDVTAMIYCMADGFLVDRMIEPGLSEDLYERMIDVFLRGLESLGAESSAGAAGSSADQSDRTPGARTPGAL